MKNKYDNMYDRKLWLDDDEWRLLKNAPEATFPFHDSYNKNRETEKLYKKHTVKINGNEMLNNAFPFEYSPKGRNVVCNECGIPLESRTMRWNIEDYDGTNDVWVHQGRPDLDFFPDHILNDNLNIKAVGIFEDEPTGNHHYPVMDEWCVKCGTVGSVEKYEYPWADYYACMVDGCDYEFTNDYGRVVS